MPEARGLKPGYEQKMFTDEEKRGKLRLVASRTGEDGSVTIHQDTKLFAGLFDNTEKATYTLPKDRHAWLHMARGEAKLNGELLKAGDAASVSGPIDLSIEGVQNAEVLLFDLA
jgi:redox-sensitive bicupin YhaK (pirin superfamily)